MEARIQTSQAVDSKSDYAIAGADPHPCRKPVGRRPRAGIDPSAVIQDFKAFLQGTFPELIRWFGELPDPRRQELCKYSGAHIWCQPLITFLSRCGSRNAYDQIRNSGQGPANIGAICGQGPDDPRFGEYGPTVTCSDNAARHARRVDPDRVAEIPLKMIRKLLKRRLLDGCRLFDTRYVLAVDGSVQEKCRAGFETGGKTARNGSGETARYRYVLQIGILGPAGIFLPVMHESMDMHDPVADKEDCEIKAFVRLAAQLKAAFPRLSFCLVGDALYAAQNIAELCETYGWKYVFTLKEGRQPSLWSEMLNLLPLVPENHLLLKERKDSSSRRDFRWVEQLPLGEKNNCNVILEGDITSESATLYAWITNFGHLTAERVMAISGAAGRERHRIEDHFNAQKNNGAGLEHVFCADPTASKNYYTLMQIAEILWQLFMQGWLKRLYEWARQATQQGLARALGEGLRNYHLPAEIPPIGQLRFVT